MNKEIKDIIRGCWQLAAGHSQENGGIKPILDAIECGFTTFDCADIYLGVEELLGKVAQAIPQQKLRIHTKFVPDLNRLQEIDRKYVESIVDRSLKRLQVDCLDLVQFHWWDWNIKNYLATMEFLSELKAKGKITDIGLANVNKRYLEEISQHFDVASLQVQISLFDRRVEQGVAQFCRQKNIKLFAYGSLLGGFVNEKWLNKKEPDLKQLANRSLIKYKLLIDSACGWEAFQQRLTILSNLATKYRCEMAGIAIGALLQCGKADALIIGLSPQNFSAQNRNLSEIPLLETQDLQEITAWPCNLHGDVYDEERDEQGAHVKVMKYDLNAR
jgi:aryl-alcohol dehydrogenase-like predicted oxidoreductase